MERTTYKVDEIAQVLGVSRDLIYQMVRERQIPFIRIGERRIVFKRDSIERWMNEQETKNMHPGAGA